MHKGKYGCHTTYQLSSIYSTHTVHKSLGKILENVFKKERKKAGAGPLAEKGQGRKTREEVGMGNQMPTLRFQTGGWHQTSPASLCKRTLITLVQQIWNWSRHIFHWDALHSTIKELTSTLVTDTSDLFLVLLLCVHKIKFTVQWHSRM